MQEAAKRSGNLLLNFWADRNPYEYFAPVAENIQIAPFPHMIRCVAA